MAEPAEGRHDDGKHWMRWQIAVMTIRIAVEIVVDVLTHGTGPGPR